MVFVPDLVTRLTVPPGLRPVSGEDCVCSENSSTESMGQSDAGDVFDAALIHGRNVMPEVVVVRAIDLPVDLVGARAIDRADSRRGIAGETGREADHLREVAAVERNVLHGLRWECGGLNRAWWYRGQDRSR